MLLFDHQQHIAAILLIAIFRQTRHSIGIVAGASGEVLVFIRRGSTGKSRSGRQVALPVGQQQPSQGSGRSEQRDQFPIQLADIDGIQLDQTTQMRNQSTAPVRETAHARNHDDFAGCS